MSTWTCECDDEGGGGGEVRFRLNAAAYHTPEHLVWPVLMAKPALQLLHMAAPFLVQSEPVLGEPFGQLHILTDTQTQTGL